jgi:hypothetical protein
VRSRPCPQRPLVALPRREQMRAQRPSSASKARAPKRMSAASAGSEAASPAAKSHAVATTRLRSPTRVADQQHRAERERLTRRAERHRCRRNRCAPAPVWSAADAAVVGVASGDATPSTKEEQCEGEDREYEQDRMNAQDDQVGELVETISS